MSRPDLVIGEWLGSHTSALRRWISKDPFQWTMSVVFDLIDAGNVRGAIFCYPTMDVICAETEVILSALIKPLCYRQITRRFDLTK